MREKYLDKTFQGRTLRLVEICDQIITSFADRGFKLTVRQLFYQLVAKKVVIDVKTGKVFENTVQNYDNLVALMTNARLAGLIDWDAIEDRTRDTIERSHWSGVKTMLQSAADWYHEDMWREQPLLVIGIVEKEALAGIFEHLFHPWDIPLLPARGYPSATALRDLAKSRMLRAGRKVVVLHFGDHDPSGIDMSRDLEERLELFCRGRVRIDFRRMALNMDQIEELNPPPNPARTTDSRYESYRAQFGDESWEVDSLTPEYLRELIRKEVEPLIDWEQWRATERRIERRREVLQQMCDNYDPDDGTAFDPPEDEEEHYDD